MLGDNQIDIKTTREIVKKLLDGESVAEIFLDKNIGDINLEKIKEIESIVKSETKNPLVKLEDKGRASVLNYNVPNSTSYRGRNFIILRHPKLDETSNFDWFRSDTK